MITAPTESMAKELARRHLAKLIDMRDEAWLHVVRAGNASAALERHAALDHAVKVLEALT